ncbi:MAG: DegV family protein [Chloroflexi bacterium]|nr:DegV family protein [Chloroflexota bacterium]
MNIAIVTDSTCDLPSEIVSQYGITVIPLSINVGDKSYLDGVDMTREEFYNQLPHFNPHPKTAAPGSEIFKQAYSRLADEGAPAIISIHLSETLSATVNSARTAAKEFTRIPVIVVDSTQLSLGMGFLVEQAAQLAHAGRSVDEVISALKESMPRAYVFAALNTLEYLRRSGRMNFALATFGDLIQLKPLLHMNMSNASAHRTRTRSKSMARLFDWLREYAPYEKLAIVHAGVEEEARAVYHLAKSFLPDGEIPIVQITPVLGAHLGIGALGFACVSAKK